MFYDFRLFRRLRAYLKYCDDVVLTNVDLGAGE